MVKIEFEKGTALDTALQARIDAMKELQSHCFRCARKKPKPKPNNIRLCPNLKLKV